MTDSHPQLPPTTESAKQRARRIPLDYHRRMTGLERTKWILTCLVGGAGAIYAGWMLVGWWVQSPAALAQFSPAPVAAPHAAWDQKCDVCHIPGVPLRGDAIGSGYVAAWLQGKPPANHAASDAKCSACHAGPAHHDNQIASEVQACASCHRDHQGQRADLARVADSVCTACHTNIAQHRSGPSLLPGPEVNVASFASHPPFRSLASGDPGQLKFNHQQHMLPGQVPSDAKDSLQKASKIAQLDCAYCHQPDGAGQYMQPINYERHCAACHADDLVLKGDVSGPIPHGLRAEAIHAVLVGLATDIKVDTAGLSPSRPLQPIPGKTPGNNLAQQLAPDLATAIEQAERLLMGADVAMGVSEAFCAKCHAFSEQPVAGTTLPEIVPTTVPSHWFAHARFDHAAHRNMKCADCHAGALPPAGGKTGDIPLDNTKLFIPNLDKCRECHAPAGTTSTAGARFDCVECHKYHGHEAVSLGGRVSRRAEPLHSSRLSRSFALPNAASRTMPLEFVSKTSSAPAPPLFVGSATCASAGCHGKSSGGKTPDWQTAYSVFAAEDPHRRAFDVLYAERSIEMYRNLTPGANRLTTSPSDADYLVFLQQRCVGCHATTDPNSSASTDLASFQEGISCESCHGPAGTWLHTHYKTGWRSPHPPGFRDLADTQTLASTCLDCHLGSSELDRRGFSVNHDLIAAGHPRLMMELEANLANYPAHWNRAGEAGSHYRHWLIGREEARTRLGRFGANPQNLAEFSAFECFDCHHALQALIKQPSSLPAAGQLSGMVRLNRALLAPWPLPISERKMQPDMLTFLSLMKRQNPAEQTWDEAVLLYLGASAIVRDLPQNHAGRAELVAAAAKLECILQEMAGQTQYDSPTRFDPGKLVEPFSEVAKALRPIASPNAGAEP